MIAHMIAPVPLKGSWRISVGKFYWYLIKITKQRHELRAYFLSYIFIVVNYSNCISPTHCARWSLFSRDVAARLTLNVDRQHKIGVSRQHRSTMYKSPLSQQPAAGANISGKDNISFGFNGFSYCCIHDTLQYKALWIYGHVKYYINLVSYSTLTTQSCSLMWQAIYRWILTT